MKKDRNDYSEFFKEELYSGFVQFLLSKYGASKVITIIGDEPLFTKKGVHTQLRRAFNEFLNRNPRIEKIFSANERKTMSLRNISAGTLYFPINAEDDDLMMRLGLRIKTLPEDDFVFPRATKEIKRNAEKMRGQIIKSNWKDKPYAAPTLLTIHFKRSYAKHIGKTTVSMYVGSEGEAKNLIFNVYDDKVAFAQIRGGQSFEFVKREKAMKWKKKSTNQVAG